ncbi:hypothetical protein [Kineosporia sp. A_224]|uniref:hypothetical protein n=1 Tax=Kineosporia sp. A_224 TaxID=1962180 RepID=UPI00117A48FA|nr:hypothetical protein [Kineosporia sp. A_224]
MRTVRTLVRGAWPGVAAAALVLLVAGCGAASGAADGAGGSAGSASASPNVTGVVLVGPRCPVQTVENPCPDTPAAAGVVVRFVGDGAGAPVRTATTGADGRFALSLAPGGYVAQPVADPGRGVMSAPPQDVMVPGTGTVDLELRADTGIR